MRTPQGEEMSRLVWEILQTANRLTDSGNRLSAPFGLTAARWQVMGAIAHQALTIAEVARRLSQTRQGVQRLADELVRDELAAYSPNPGHRRAKLLAPTTRGATSYRELMEAQAKWMNALCADLRLDDIAAARGVLAKLASALENSRS
ncbi:MarR family transcriptional regulator [Methylocystis sp. JR02]|uniref:MarR family winged helix-turn-helix transcriptional regulator n=1 Tax=Methylocystis sp. JR02 TaxID=3046284 RepID=UPI0024BB9BDF|nr:MarR family transcriptional regulator [Methylocystis sp. JR02]MDJ0447728.1 MarR family transcriptional regulator [Methylocystis sp. JR02]